ncbi:MAG: hypothetical protein H6Q52_372 [Deltaproteobacteria bacterium]|nr:hypothetical protein [Deltaproteobacteria bacterium]
MPLDNRPAGRPGPKTLYIVILIFLVIAAGSYYAYRYFRIAQQPKPVVASDTIDLKLYYPVPPAKLGVKNVSVKADLTDKEKAEVIIAGLKEDKILPAGVSLTDFAADADGTLLLNFSPELTVMKPDPVTEIQTVYSIINSFLANFSRAKNVQLLAGGQAFFTINGTVYTYKPIEFNSHILED